MNVGLIDQMWEKTKVVDRCWLWQGARTGSGYPAINLNGSIASITRLSLVIYHKVKYKDNWLACHICNNKDCWNPLHLYVGTAGSNSRDIVKAGNHPESIKTHCPKGHAYTKDNTYIKPRTNKRECRICRRNSATKSTWFS